MHRMPPIRPGCEDIADMMGRVRTKSELAALFRHLNLSPNKGLGQCFLVDHNLLRFMVRAGEVGPRDLVVDIGCGTGLLTAHLADAAAWVIGVEVDRRLMAICSRYLEGRGNVRLICGDALASKHKMAPTLLEAIQGAWATGGYAALRVVSNLPYCIASLVVPNLLESGLPIAAMLVTLQKEVADRMAAGPGSRDYGALSVVVQANAAAALLRPVPPAVFWPRPKVHSAIVRVVPSAERRRAILDYPQFVELVRAAFAHRRKTLANALAASHAFGEAGAAEPALTRCGIEPGTRAERVSVEKYAQLANVLLTRNP